MTEESLKELSELVQSSNVNFLIGAGASTPYLPLLGNIEKELTLARDDRAKELQYKRYFRKVMLPNKNILGSNLSTHVEFRKTKSAYENFFKKLSEIILLRRSTILSKQVNIFTTNIDILMEDTLEGLRMEYNDGFSGKFQPLFNVANYKRSIFQRSLHYDHISEVPLFNIVKVHGSLTWMNDITHTKIVFSPRLEHIHHELLKLNGAEFFSSYKRILIVNPEAAKLLESVLNFQYSELLRMYSSELEKENTMLFVIGFSMEDQHIREITARAATSNPTLRIFICCSKRTEKAMRSKMMLSQHPNIQILTPRKRPAKFTLKYFTDNILTSMVNKPHF